MNFLHFLLSLFVSRLFFADNPTVMIDKTAQSTNEKVDELLEVEGKVSVGRSNDFPWRTLKLLVLPFV